jgi:hypothetical protein
MEEDPFVNLDENRLLKIFRKHHICTPLEVVKREYIDYLPEYFSSIVDDVPDVLFADETQKVFDFKKSWTIKDRKDEINKWLKKYWEYFRCDTFEQLTIIIVTEIENFNEENPKIHRPYVNWIHQYGGLVAEPNRFPDEKELNYMKQAQIAVMYHCSQEEKKQVEDKFITPEDIPY